MIFLVGAAMIFGVIVGRFSDSWELLIWSSVLFSGLLLAEWDHMRVIDKCIAEMEDVGLRHGVKIFWRGLEPEIRDLTLDEFPNQTRMEISRVQRILSKISGSSPES